MIKTIINFLFRKRFKNLKILKSKRGFSLLEVLVAVAIIGIITAIAVPQFTANRNEAAKVASDTSVSNIIKAFNNCRVLKGFSECDTLTKIRITCPDCHNDTAVTTPNNKFCAHIKKGSDPNNPDFAACVSITEGSSGNTITRTYGGALLNQVTICKTECSSCGAGNSAHEVTTAKSPVQTCETASTCTADTCGHASCTATAKCEAGGDGECDGSSNCG